ncbi:MAG: RNA polymerase sigma factor [Erysipelotrichales bacterium]|nr:RNA polymerase sigma factor [Erysipelotrichales bacterium]
MENKTAQLANGVEEIMDIYGNMLFRMCLIRLGNANDAEDAVQETMIKYVQKNPYFKDAEHQKAWLIRVASNKCKDIIRLKNKHLTVNIDEINEFTKDRSGSDIISALMTLPDKYKTVLILHYVEGYDVRTIANAIGRTSSAVKMRLQKGRKLLAEAYRKEWI